MAVAVVVQHLGDLLGLLVADGACLEEGRQKAGQGPVEGPLQHLLPIGPLDGGKILAWNKVVWGLMFVIAVIEIACVYLVFDVSYIPYVNPFL